MSDVARFSALAAEFRQFADEEDNDQWGRERREVWMEAARLLDARGADVVPPRLTVSELRKGEENDGPLQSTDIFLEWGGMSLLVNIPAGSSATYSLVSGYAPTQTGWVLSAPVPIQLQDQRSAPEWTCRQCGKDLLFCGCPASGRGDR
jgi:hypothetical protein